MLERWTETSCVRFLLSNKKVNMNKKKYKDLPIKYSRHNIAMGASKVLVGDASCPLDRVVSLRSSVHAELITYPLQLGAVPFPFHSQKDSKYAKC